MATGSAARIIRQIIHITVGQRGGRGEKEGERKEGREGDYSCPNLTLSREKGLVTVECFLGCDKLHTCSRLGPEQTNEIQLCHNNLITSLFKIKTANSARKALNKHLTPFLINQRHTQLQGQIKGPVTSVVVYMYIELWYMVRVLLTHRNSETCL